jgi:hypothetical protein
MEPISKMNKMMQMMMSKRNTIKIKPFSGKAKHFPK